MHECSSSNDHFDRPPGTTSVFSSFSYRLFGVNSPQQVATWPTMAVPSRVSGRTEQQSTGALGGSIIIIQSSYLRIPIWYKVGPPRYLPSGNLT